VEKAVAKWQQGKLRVEQIVWVDSPDGADRLRRVYQLLLDAHIKTAIVPPPQAPANGKRRKGP